MTRIKSQDGRLNSERDGVVMKVKPVVMLSTMPAGWINRRRQDVATYLKEENKILWEKRGIGNLENPCVPGSGSKGRALAGSLPYSSGAPTIRLPPQILEAALFLPLSGLLIGPI